MLSTSSSPDAICVCGHPHSWHTTSRCTVCDRESTKDFMHAFRLPGAEPIVDVELPEPKAPSPEHHDHCFDHGPQAATRTCCQCGALPEEPAGCIACGGPDCICDDRCTCGHKRKHHNAFWCNKCRAKGAPIHIQAHRFELETIEGWPCGACGATVPGNLDWCPACDELASDAAEAAEAALHDEWSPPIQMPRRPPYAVAYAVQDGHVYEIALPGDATVIAEDGLLKISHALGPVLAITHVSPMFSPKEALSATDSEEQDAREI